MRLLWFYILSLTSMVHRKYIFLKGYELNRNVFPSIFLVHNHHFHNLWRHSVSQYLLMFDWRAMFVYIWKFFFMIRHHINHINGTENQKSMYWTLFSQWLVAYLKNILFFHCLEVFCSPLIQYSKKHVKQRFDISHTTTRSAETFRRSCRKYIRLRKVALENFRKLPRDHLRWSATSLKLRIDRQQRLHLQRLQILHLITNVCQIFGNSQISTSDRLWRKPFS